MQTAQGCRKTYKVVIFASFWGSGLPTLPKAQISDPADKKRSSQVIA